MNRIKKETVKQKFDTIIRVGDGLLNDLLSCEEPIGYVTWIDGLNSDVYSFNNDVAICVGYYPFGTIRALYATCKKYDRIACKFILSCYAADIDYSVKKEKLRWIINKFIKEVQTEGLKIKKHTVWTNDINTENSVPDWLDVSKRLDFSLPQEIIVIGDIERYGKRELNYDVIGNGKISDCLYLYDEYMTWYVNKKMDLCCEGCHEGGVNFFLYRVIKDSISEQIKKNFLDKVYDGKVTKTHITQCTEPLGEKIAKAYGWKISEHGQKCNKN